MVQFLKATTQWPGGVQSGMSRIRLDFPDSAPSEVRIADVLLRQERYEEDDEEEDDGDSKKEPYDDEDEDDQEDDGYSE